MLYHVTFADRLPGIAKKGLRIGQKMTVQWQQEAQANVKGRLFFTKTLESAKLWGLFVSCAYWENFQSTSTVPVPVLLRMEYSGRLWPDEGFGLTDSVFGVEGVPPENIELWDPVKFIWITLNKVPKELVHDHFGLDPENPKVSVPAFFERVKQYVSLEWPESE